MEVDALQREPSESLTADQVTTKGGEDVCVKVATLKCSSKQTQLVEHEENKRAELASRLTSLEKQKHRLVLALKQVLNSEEESKRRLQQQPGTMLVRTSSSPHSSRSEPNAVLATPPPQPWTEGYLGAAKAGNADSDFKGPEVTSGDLEEGELEYGRTPSSPQQSLYSASCPPIFGNSEVERGLLNNPSSSLQVTSPRSLTQLSSLQREGSMGRLGGFYSGQLERSGPSGSDRFHGNASYNPSSPSYMVRAAA
eukprot:SM000200S05826  [mRNA]  locus=s200:101552:103182:+ [translate_table: standard]